MIYQTAIFGLKIDTFIERGVRALQRSIKMPEE